MIPRLLVPKDARASASPSDAPPPRRLSSELDARTLVPSNLPHIKLDARTSIPAYRPLDVLGARTVIPRDMPSTPLDAATSIPEYALPSILNSRVAVPKDAHPVLLEEKYVPTWNLPDVLDRDVLNTGEVNLMTQPVEERASAAWNAVARTASIALHFVVLLLILFSPKLFPYRPPTEEEIARQKSVTNVFLPNYLNQPPAPPAAPPQPRPRVRVDPRILNKIAPPHEVQPTPNPPEPERVAPNNPAPPRAVAPMPQPQPLQPRPQPQIETQIRPQMPAQGITLPRLSPGKALEDSMHEALKDGGGASVGFGDPVGPMPSGGGMGGGGGAQGYMGGGLEMLTPTEGVDFTGYLARVLASVKRNWYAVIPESARLGERGKVVLQFRILRNGVVPEAEPAMMGSSGKEPLDRAAVSSIRASTPFEPLPTAFSGPYIELRFTFLYNLPLNTQ